MIRKRIDKLKEKRMFILKYSLRALLSLAILFAGLYLFKILYFDHNPDYWIERFYRNPLVIYLIYIGSEVFFGIFPPELFMFWAIKAGSTLAYVFNIIFFGTVSMGAGHLAYWIGRYLRKRVGKSITKKKFVSKYLPTVRKFGGVLIVVAALTPLPWSTISLVMGVVEYNYKRFSYYALSRVLRFVVNGFLVYHSGSLLF